MISVTATQLCQKGAIYDTQLNECSYASLTLFTETGCGPDLALGLIVCRLLASNRAWHVVGTQ